MAEKRTRTVNLFITPNAFTSLFRRFRGEKTDYDFSNLADLRRLISNEKAKILNVIKLQKPSSLYHLAKLLQRDFKSVREDVKLLEKFGFIELVSEKEGNRKKLKPVIAIDSLNIVINFQ